MVHLLRRRLRLDRWCFLFVLFLGLAAASCLSTVFSFGTGLEVTGESGIPFRLEFRESISDSVIQEVYATIRAFPGVVTVDYRTPTRAYLLLQEARPHAVAFLEKYHISNPFPHTFLVTLRSPDLLSTFRDFVASSQWKDAIQPSSLLMEVKNETSVRMVFFSILLLMIGISILVFAETLSRFAVESGELVIGQLSGTSLSRILLSFTIWLAFIFLCASATGYGFTLLVLYGLDMFHFVSFSFVKIFSVLLMEVVLVPFFGHSVSLWLIDRALQASPLDLRA